MWLDNAYIPEYLYAEPLQSRDPPPAEASPPQTRDQPDGERRPARRDDGRSAPASTSTTVGAAKVELALARGKKLHDKRDTEKKRDWDREKGRLLRDKG